MAPSAERGWNHKPGPLQKACGVIPRGAVHLFRLIHRLIHKGRLGLCNAGQSWMSREIAKRIRASVRSVKRWLAWLVSQGYVEVIRRPNQTSMYRIIKDLAPPMAPPMAPPLKEEPSEEPRVNKPARKPMQVAMPAEHITLASGRRILNPVWTRVRDAIRQAYQSGRVQNARNRDAYLAAIIRAESRTA